MTAMKAIDLITALEKAGYSEMRSVTIKTILVLYELGSLTRNELATITGVDVSHMSRRINQSKSMGLYTKSGAGTRSNPTIFRLNTSIRNIIKAALGN